MPRVEPEAIGGRMRIIIEPDAAAVALRAAMRIADLIRRSPTCVLGLPTGRTPLELYRELVRRHSEDGLSFSQVVTFNLDEYIGLQPHHPESYTAFMRQNLIDYVDIDPANTHIPNGRAEDLGLACESYEDAIRTAGGIDLQILGIGSNGHIGFNEPGSSLGSRTRVKTLSSVTLRDNRLEHAGFDAPTMAITMGIGTVLDARALLMLATGSAKAAAVAAAVEGPLAARCPASAIQLHPNATVVLDPEAAAELRLTDYYELVDQARRLLTRRSGRPASA